MNLRSPIRLSLAILLLAVLADPALATDYFVRPDGNDSCNGTGSGTGSGGDCAWRSVGMCFGFGGNAPGAGDRCLVTPGEYYGWNTTEDREQSNSGSLKSGNHSPCSCTHDSMTVTCQGVDVRSAGPVVQPGDFVQCTAGYGFSWTEVESVSFSGGNSTIHLVEPYRGCDYQTCNDGGGRQVNNGNLQVAEFVQILGWDLARNGEIDDPARVVLTAWKDQPADVAWTRVGTCSNNPGTACTSDGNCSGGNCRMTSVYRYNDASTSDPAWSSPSGGFREDYDTWDIWDGLAYGTLSRGDPLRRLETGDDACGDGSSVGGQIRKIDRVPGTWFSDGTRHYVHMHNGADPDSLDMQASAMAPSTTNFLIRAHKEYTIIGGLTGEAANADPNDGHGAPAFEVGESNTLHRDLLIRTGNLRVFPDNDDVDVRFESVRTWGGAIANLSTNPNVSGLHFYDFECRGGRTNCISFDYLRGPSAVDRVVFDRMYLHQTWTDWKEVTWDCASDTWAQADRYAHGLYIGNAGSARDNDHILVQNSIFEATGDGLGIFHGRGARDIVVRNCTFGWKGYKALIGNTSDGNWGIEFRNVAFYRKEGNHGNEFLGTYGLGGSSCPADNVTADRNAFIYNGNSANVSTGEHWWTSDGCGRSRAGTDNLERVANPQGYDEEQTSFVVCTGVSCSGQYGTYYNAAAHGFQNPNISTTSGGDYRLTSASYLIDAGDGGACPDEDFFGNPRNVDGDGDGQVECDIGAVEYQGSDGSAAREYYFEAEDGSLTNPVHADNSQSLPASFGGWYIETDAGAGDVLSGEPSGKAAFQVNITSADDYTVWVRLYAPVSGQTSFWESFDGGGNHAIAVGQTGAWVWVRGQTYSLSQGVHTFYLKHRHEQAKADRILITSVEGRNPYSEEPPPPPPPDVTGLNRRDR